MQLAQRMEKITPSATLAISQKAALLQQQGADVISLSAGEPDFDTPDCIKQAAIRAIEQGFTKYTAVEGIASLKQAIAEKFWKDNGLRFDPASIIVSTGGKQSIYNCLQALINPGDEVIVPAPYWVSYPDMVYLAGGVVRTVDTAPDFILRPEQLEAAITSRTRLLILNSPANPTGVAYTRAAWEKLAEILRLHPHIWIATDDMYEKIWWKSEETFSNIAMVAPDLLDRTIILHGVSKTYAMTGWRIGYAAGPQPLIRAMGIIQSQSTSNPNSIAQVAACAALQDPNAGRIVEDMVQAFQRRHHLLYTGLRQLPGIRVTPADGTFYIFPHCQEAIQRTGLSSDVEWCAHLLDRYKLALVPGTAFGAPGYVRLSYATNERILEAALDRLQQAVS